MSAWDSATSVGAGSTAGAATAAVVDAPVETTADVTETAETEAGDGEVTEEGVEETSDETAGQEEAQGQAEEAVTEGAGDDDAAKAIKAGTFKLDADALKAAKERMKKGFPGLPENVIHKLAANELYIAHMKQMLATGKPDDKIGSDGLTEYERSMVEADRAEKKTANPAAKVEPGTQDPYEHFFGKVYESPDEELAADTALVEKYSKGEITFRDYKTAQTRKLRSTLYRDKDTRAVISQIMAEELESAGILPSALKEMSRQSVDKQDWDFALQQLAPVKGFESLVELSKVTSPEQLRLPDGTFVPDTQLNRLRLENWDDIKDIRVEGKNARQTAVNTNLARLRALNRIQRNKLAAAQIATSAAQTGVEAGKKSASAQARAGLNGGGKTPTTTGAKNGFGKGDGTGNYSDQFKDRGTRFSDI